MMRPCRQPGDLARVCRRHVIRAALAALVVAQPAAAWAKPLDPRISAADAHTAASTGKVVLIDIRTPQEWRQTGLPASAYAITMHQSQEEFLRALVAVTNGSRSAPIALICAVGSRSAGLSGWLRGVGYTSVRDVSEGMIGGGRGRGWIRSGLPVRQWSPGHSAP